MKKIIPFICIFILVPLLFSCAKLPDANGALSSLNEPYTCEIAVNDGDGIYTASVTRTAAGELTLRLAEPALLCGVEYVCGDGGISVVYNELKIPLGDYSNGKISRGVTAWRGMLTPDGENARVSSDGKGRYTVTSGEVEYRFDMETNAPVLIKNGDITITITNFRREIDKSSEGAG